MKEDEVLKLKVGDLTYHCFRDEKIGDFFVGISKISKVVERGVGKKGNRLFPHFFVDALNYTRCGEKRFKLAMSGEFRSAEEAVLDAFSRWYWSFSSPEEFILRHMLGEKINLKDIDDFHLSKIDSSRNPKAREELASFRKCFKEAKRLDSGEE